MSQLTDDGLLQRFADHRDAEAFAALVKRHLGLVHATCRRETGDEVLAEDAAQATFLLLAQKAKGLRAERSLASWLFVAARQTARNLVREERRRKAREARAARPERTMNDAHDAWDELEPHLNDALARLPAKDRQVVILRYLEGRSLAEVAQELGLGEGAARMRASRALERLRSGLGRAGVAVSATALAALLARDAQAAVPVHLSTRLLAVSAPPAASSGTGGAWPLLAKGLSLTLATSTTKALAVSGAALVLAGGFVAYRHKAVDDATVRAAFRPLVGKWRGVARMPGPPDGRMQSMALLLDMKPEKDGLGLALTMRFPDQHQGERKHLSVDAKGQLIVEAQGQPTERYRPTGLREFAARGGGKLDFAGRLAEGPHPMDLKLGFDLRGDRLTMRQSAKPDGEREHGNDVTLERVR